MNVTEGDCPPYREQLSSPSPKDISSAGSSGCTTAAGCNSRMEVPAVLAARAKLSRQRSTKVAMFHWLTCLSDTAETGTSEDGGLEVGLLTLLSGQ